MARSEIGFGSRLRETVPRADQLAVIATIDAVADQGAQLLGDRAVQLDSEIGDAAARIQLVRRNDGAGRADVETGMAGAAMIRGGGIHPPRQNGGQLAPGKT